MVETVPAHDDEGVAAAALLLHDFNEEYDEPAPEPETLADLLSRRITDGHAKALL